jgi:hypothetical protein
MDFMANLVVIERNWLRKEEEEGEEVEESEWFHICLPKRLMM